MSQSNNWNVDNLTTEEANGLMNKLVVKSINDLQAKQKQMEVNVSELQQDVKHIRDTLNTQNQRLQQQEKVTNVIGFGYHSVNLSKIRNLCRTRVHQLLGKKGDPAYDLLSRCYFSKIYRDLAGECSVDKIANVHMADYEKLMELSKKWTPTDAYVTEKIEEFKHQYENQSESMADAGKRRTFELFCQQENIDLTKEAKQL